MPERIVTVVQPVPPTEAPRGGQTVVGSAAGASPAPPEPLEPFGEYEQIEPAGQGGMGVVYKAWHRGLHRHEAIKMVRSGQLAGPNDLARFHFEAEAAAGLDHPNIVPVYGVGEHNGRPYLALKWIDGGSLTGHLASYQPTPEDVARILAVVARAVHFAHQRGILHRDLKPDNILVDRAGVPHVSDFGLAKKLDSEGTLAQSGALVGTLNYMAPEQGRGEKNLTTAADVYGLGAVLYECLTGRPPFDGPSVGEVVRRVTMEPPPAPRAVNPEVPRDLEAVCLKCLEKDPKNRYASAEELAEDLERFARGEPIAVSAPGLWDWLRQVTRVRPPQSPNYSWQVKIWYGIILLGLQGALYALVRTGGTSYDVWIAHIIAWVAMGLATWHFLVRRFRHLPETERHSAMVAVGFMPGTIALMCALVVPSDKPRSAEMILDTYPAVMVVAGLAFFIVGSTHWSVFLWLGLGLMALAPVTAFWATEAPIVCGVSVTACLLYWAYALKYTFGGKPAAPTVKCVGSSCEYTGVRRSDHTSRGKGG
jgi:serine/threonine-protein kinase